MMLDKDLRSAFTLSICFVIFSAPLLALDHPLTEKSESREHPFPRQSKISPKPQSAAETIEPQLDLSPTTPEEAYKVLGLAEQQHTTADIRKAFVNLGMIYTLKKDGLGPKRLQNINKAHKILKMTATSTSQNSIS
jgi:hypothetical protein